MNKIRTNKILIPVDFSKTSLYAIKYAAFTAKLTKGELILVNVQKENDFLDIILPALKLKNANAITEFLEEKIEKLAGTIKKKYGIKVTPIVSSGSIASEIVSMAKETKSGMIVMGTHGKDSSNDMFLGSNSYRVLTKSKIPVMTVQSGTDKLGFSRILIPIDMSAHSRQKVDSAIYMAGKFNARIHAVGLLHESEQGDEYTMNTVLEQITNLAGKQKVICTTEIRYSKNHAKETLAAAKKEKSNLIIAMTDQEAEFSGIILGTYIHQLINESKIPVLCIPPIKHEETADVDSIGGMW